MQAQASGNHNLRHWSAQGLSQGGRALCAGDNDKRSKKEQPAVGSCAGGLGSDPLDLLGE